MKKTTAMMIGLLFTAAGFVGAVEVPINPITPDIREKVRESTELVGQVDELAARECGRGLLRCAAASHGENDESNADEPRHVHLLPTILPARGTFLVSSP